MKQQPLYDFIKNEIIKHIVPQDRWSKFIDFCTEKNYDLLVEEQKDVIDQIVYKDILGTVTTFFDSEKENGRLTGKNHNERVLQFEEMYNNTLFEAMVRTYPILFQREGRKLKDYINLVEEIIKNYSYDADSIEDIFGRKFGKITSISVSKGDNHFGKSVSIVKFENGTLVYKPRNLAIDEVLKKILDELHECDRNILQCKIPLFLSYKNHSWQEFIEYCECENIEQVYNYYKRIGVYLAVFYMLSSTDMHFENVIAYGEFPIFIDLESITKGVRGDRDYSFYYKLLSESVLATNILPLSPEDSFIDLNFSAIFTGEQVSEKNYAFSIQEDSQEGWVYKRVHTQFKPVNNIVKCNGREISPELVEKDVILGFLKTMKCFFNNRQKFVSIIKSLENNSIQIRQLLRPTAVYSRFLYASIHPNNTTSIERYNGVFEILLNKFTKTSFGYLRVMNEIENLKKGYIPLFSSQLDERHLYSGDDIVCENYFLESPRETIINKLLRIDENNLEDQIELIKISFLYLYGPGDRVSTNGKVKHCGYYEKKDIIELLKNYTEFLKKKIYKISDGSYGIVMPIMKGKGFLPVNINIDLYNYGGLIWYLAVYGKVFGDTVVSEMAQGLFKLMYSTLENRNKKNISDHSIFTGDGSVLYLCANLYMLYQTSYYKKTYGMEMDRIVQVINEYNFESENALDFLSGGSGTLYVVCKLVHNIECDDIISKEWLVRISSRYCVAVENNIEKFQYGFAHGISGVCITLAALYRVTQNDKCFNLLTKLVDKENQLKGECISRGWCRGDVGVCLSHYLIQKEVPQMQFKDIQEIIGEEIDSLIQMDNMCLCHGKYGNIDMILKIRGVTDKEMFRKWFDQINDIKFYEKTDYSFESFMIGTSGVAYTFLRLLDPKLPSLLALDLYNNK